MKNHTLLLAIGQLSLAFGILTDYFLPETELTSFLAGLFIGLSIVSGFMVIVLISRDPAEKKKTHYQSLRTTQSWSIIRKKPGREK